MPPFAGQLTDQQIADVAAYVVAGRPAADSPRPRSRPTCRRSPATSTARWSAGTACCGRGRARRSPVRRHAGIPVVVATGRMFRSVRPYLDEAGIADPVVCYQGAAVVDPTSGTFLLHEPIPLETRARGDRGCSPRLGYPPNCYVDDRLYVERQTEYSRMYAGFQHLPVERGRRPRRLARAARRRSSSPSPTRTSCRRCGRRLAASASTARLFLTTSLPYLLELGQPGRLEGDGPRVRGRPARVSTASAIVAFGDGENDIELIEEAGFGIAVDDGNPLLLERADWICPGPEDEGVATVIDAYLDSRRMIDLQGSPRRSRRAGARRSRARARRGVRRAARGRRALARARAAGRRAARRDEAEGQADAGAARGAAAGEGGAARRRGGARGRRGRARDGAGARPEPSARVVARRRQRRTTPSSCGASASRPRSRR